MNSFKERCIELRKQDYSLLEIARITNRPKTSVYFHIRNTSLSEKRLEKVRTAHRIRFAALAQARKGKSTRAFRKFIHWNENNVFLIAHLIFDGELNGRSCSYNNRSEKMVRRFIEEMKHLYDLEPKLYHNKLTGVLRASYHNVALSAYLKEKAKELIERVSKMETSLRRTFLQAFFDDEGCVDFRPKINSRRVRGYQKDLRTLQLIQKVLRSFKIDSKIQLPNEIVVSKKSNLNLFRDEINFSVGIYMNGNRTNSARKKHIEKRELLAQALASYK